MTSIEGGVDIVGLSLHVDSKLLSIAILAWVLHEIIVTSEDAVTLFWIQRWSVSKVLFFVNGFAAVLAITMTNAINLIAFDSKSACAVVAGGQFAGAFLILCTETFMLATRVWALWRGHYILLTIYFFIVSGNLFNFLFTYGISLIQGTVLLKQLPYTGCYVSPSFNSSWITIGICLGFETLSICLIVYRTWLVRRLTGVKTPLFSQLLEEGLAHYLLFVAAKLFVVGCVFVPTVIGAVTLPSMPHFVVVALVINRFFLRLRRTMLSQTPGLTDYTTTGFAVFKHDTGGGNDGGKGITTIGGTDKAGRRIQAQRHSHLDGELFSLGGGDVEMSLNKKEEELHPSDSIIPTSSTSGSSSNVVAPVLDAV